MAFVSNANWCRRASPIRNHIAKTAFADFGSCCRRQAAADRKRIVKRTSGETKKGTWRAALLGLLAALFLVLLLPGARMDSQAAQARGIDVSAWQGPIDWQAVKNSGVTYAMIRVGNTEYGMDEYFAQNMIGANAAGLRVGVYVYTYATNALEAIQEAQFVLAAVAPFTVSFPIAIDIEDEVHKPLSPAQQAEIANAFCATVYNAGYTPMVYASRNWFLTRMAPVAWDHWVAQYNDYCDYPGYAMWQATSKGSVPGIAGNVDINYLFKDYFTQIIANGFQTRAGNTYYYKNYKQQVGLQTVENKLYFFDATGAMYKGWLGAGAAKYYFTADGSAAMGWQTIENARYYFGANGLATVGIASIDGANYLFDANGVMTTGWFNNNGLMNYFGADGKQLFGLQVIDGATYYFNELGAMSVGLQNTPTGVHYFGADGRMATGLVTMPDGSTYDFDGAGNMLTGWQLIGAGYYYFGADGKMVVNATFLDNAGIPVTVDATGLMIAPQGYAPQ